MGQEATVEAWVNVQFAELRGGEYVAVPGALGVGRSADGRSVFGEVMYPHTDSPEFSMRCYELSEQLPLERFSEQGLVLDAGTSRPALMVSAAEMRTALEQLPRPIALLHEGDTVSLHRNPHHPAWQRPVETPYGRRYELPEDFQAVLSDGITITDRVEHPGKPVQLRAQNGFWYTAEGRQEDANATFIQSETNLLGTALVRDVAPVVEAAPQLDAAAAVDVPSVTERLKEQLEALQACTAQWNPHHPVQLERIQRYEVMAENVTAWLSESEEPQSFVGELQLEKVSAGLEDELVAIGAGPVSHRDALLRSNAAGATVAAPTLTASAELAPGAAVSFE